MRVVVAIAKWVVIAVVVVVAAAATWLWFAPPDLIRVAAGYSAKIVCSNVFLANRDVEEVLSMDVQAPGHPILRLIDVSVDRQARTVRAGLFGLFGGGLAVARDGVGCTLVPDGDLDAVAAVPAITPAGAKSGIWPEGIAVSPPADRRIASILDNRALTGDGMRAVVVVRDGRIVGERYSSGFSADTPLLGWSMAKPVTAAVIGTLIKDRRLSLDDKALLPAWANDDRKDIAIRDLTAMSSGLEFNEDYGDVTDVTRMLYLEPDMAAFAGSKPLVAPVATVWNYSSGTTVLLARIWQNRFADRDEALQWPRKKLFDVLGMRSAVMETDARGTFVGSSHIYATARDWARFGLFILQDGVWNGEAVLPEGYVAWMRSEVAPSNGEYGNGQVWLRGPSGDTPEGENPDAGFNLPDDAYWFNGHDGQSIAVIPSRRLVVVRLGLTPSTLNYKPQALVEALAEAFPSAGG